MNKADVFSRIYRENHWASAETRSGVGSEMGRTQSVRERLPWLFDVLGAKSVLDAGCGDLNWMQHVEAQVEYVGVDIVPEAEPFCLPWPWLLLPEDELDPNAPFNPGYLGLWRLGSDIDGLS